MPSDLQSAGERLTDAAEHFIRVRPGIDDGVFVGHLLRLGGVAVGDAAVVVGALLLHAVEQGAEAAGGGGLIDVEDDGQVGPGVADGDLAHAQAAE